MENKYYTPDISEFHVGFEYERANIDNNWTIRGWENNAVSPDTDLKTITVYPNYQRVKYLNREGIERLGFTESEDTEDWYDKTDGNREIWISLEYFQEGKGWYLSIDSEDSELSFLGWIKNKSELEKLLKQLNIK